MNKNTKLGLTLLTLFTIPLAACSKAEVESNTYRVDFFNNYLREEFTLSNEFVGKGNNLLYKSIDVEKDSLLAKPEDPVRLNYDFNGWFKEEKCLTAWDFEKDIVSSNLRLFAKWSYSGADNITEPEYTPPYTKLDNAAPYDYIVTSVMNFKIDGTQVGVSKAALDKLNASKENVLPLLEYKVKDGFSITATFDGTNITVVCNGASKTIRVTDASANYKLDNSSYETKAKNYEAKALEEESYHVMLAGSSSIEFWETSKEDLAPIVSYNHGIGGTTIEEWDEKLNQRLVLPYKPKMVVYYVGINNVINTKQNTETISNNLVKFFDDTHAALPNTKVQYILMNLIPGYVAHFDTIKAVNAVAVEYQKTHSSWLTLINPGEALVKENGEPNAAYFRTDGLHLSYYGYVVWGAIIKQSIINGLNKK